MRMIVEYYGKSWIAVLVALCVFGIFSELTYEGKRGIPAILGHTMTKVLIQKEMYQNQMYETHMDHVLPEIYVKEDCKIVAGQYIEIQSCFGAKDCTGIELMVKIEDVWKGEGEAVQVSILPNDTFCIHEPGQYWLKLSATDTNGFRKEVITQIFVNRV